MRSKVEKTLHYKRAKFEHDGKQNLEGLLVRAMASKGRASERLQETAAGGEKNYRLINRLEAAPSLTTGVMMSFTEGVHQHVVTVSDEAEQFDLTQLAPELEDPDLRSEFVQGLLFFGVKRNHLILMTSPHLRADGFEKHLRWLLKEHTSVMPKIETLYVADPTPEFEDRSFTGVKSFTISSSLAFEEEELAGRSTEKLITVDKDHRSWQALTAFFDGFGADEPDVNFQGGMPPEDLEVQLLIRAKGRRRDLSRVPTPVLDPIANAFRHVDDAPIVVEFLNGSKLKGSGFKVRQPWRIECQDGVPVTQDVFNSMREWFEGLVQKGDIEAE